MALLVSANDTVWGHLLPESSFLEFSRVLNLSQGKNDPDPYLNGNYMM